MKIKIFITILFLTIINVCKSQNITYGSEYAANAASSTYTTSCSISDSTFVIAYATSSGVKVRFGTVAKITQTQVSYGTEATVDATASSSYVNVGKLSSTSFVILYNDGGASGRANVCTISGTTITVNTQYIVNSGNTAYFGLNILSETTFVAVYSDGNNSNYLSARFGTISGTSISFGTEAVYAVSNLFFYKTCSLSSSIIVISFRDSGNGNIGKTIIGSISGTNISFSGATKYSSGEIVSNSGICKLNSTQFIVVFYDFLNSNKISYRIGTYNGSTTVFGSTSSSSTSTASSSTNVSLFLFDDNSIISTFNSGSTSINLWMDFSGTSITIGNSYQFKNSSTLYPNGFLLDATKFVTTYSGTSNYSNSIVGIVEILGKKINGVLYSKWNNTTITKWNNQ